MIQRDLKGYLVDDQQAYIAGHLSAIELTLGALIAEASSATDNLLKSLRDHLLTTGVGGPAATRGREIAFNTMIEGLPPTDDSETWQLRADDGS